MNDENAGDTTSTTAIAPTTTPTTVPAVTTTTAPGLAGVAYVGDGPQAGDLVSVIGVPFDESLPVSAMPGVEQGLIAELSPDSNGVPVTGRARLVEGSIWYEIEVNEGTGWVDAASIALIGATDDAASAVAAALGETPSADTMLDLGSAVAESFVGDESRGRITVAVAPSTGDLGEVTYDVIGLADDAIVGYRLHVFGQQMNGAGPFSLHSVERTMLCWRGITDNGTCS